MKKNLSILVFLIIILISNISFADATYVHKGKEYTYEDAGNEWDAFCYFFWENWYEEEGRKELTDEELRRFIKGGTDEERYGGIGMTVATTGISIDEVKNELETRGVSGGNGTDMQKWKEARDEAIDLYNKAVAEKDSEKKKKIQQQFLKKCEEMRKYSSKGTLGDSDIQDKYEEVSSELNQSTDAMYNNQVNNNGDTVPLDESPKRIYTQPRMADTKDTASASLDDMITDGEKFIHDTRTSDEATIKESDIQNLSQLLYNSLLIVGVVIAVIIGGIIGIKLMISSAEEKAEVKQYLVPYVAGCIIVFGAFGIWKLVVTILQNVNL